jgi:WD40 repeat protein
VVAVACTQLDGRPIAVTTGYDATVRIWDLTTRRQIDQMDLPTAGQTLAVTSVGGIVAGFGWDIVLLERTSGAQP